MQTYAGTDSSQLRMRDIHDGGATVFVEEESCTDDEMNHAAEIVGWFAMDSATTGVSDEYDQIIHAQTNLDRGCEALYDATSADLHGAVLDRNSAGSLGHQSQGGIDFINAADDTATWTIMNCRSGHYYVIFGYALGGGADRPMSVTVNQVVVDGYTSFPRTSTGGWNSYSEVKVPVRLDAGTNTIVLKSIGFSGPNVDYMAISPIGPVGYGETTTIGEGGRVRTIDYRLTYSGLTGQTVDPEEQWLTVHLGSQYTDPVVIVGPPTEVGGGESVARIRSLRYSTAQAAGQTAGGAAGGITDNNLSDNACDGHCFDLRLQEPSCQDDIHVEEEVAYLVLDAGTWFTDDGKMIQVGRLPVSGVDTSTTCCQPGGNPAGTTSCCIGSGEGILTGGWSDVTFHVPFPDDEVAIFTQVQTYNDPMYVKTRNKPLAPAGGAACASPPCTFGGGFQVALERDQVQGTALGTHGIESVGWIAIQHGQSTLGGDLYQADMTDDRITSDPTSGGIAFCSGFTRPPLFFANMMTYDGGDPSQLRLQQAVSATQANVYVEEVTCDSATNDGAHTTEIVSYLAIDHSANHKIRATAQAPTQGMVHTGGQVPHGQGVDCGGAADVGDNPGWAWQDTAGQAGVQWGGATGSTHGVNGNGASADSCFSAIQNSLDDINTICCREKGACAGGASVSSGGGFPTVCSSDCAGLWAPIWNVCSAYITTLFASDPVMAASVGPFSSACDAQLYGDTCTESFFTQGMLSFDGVDNGGTDICDVGTATGAGYGRFGNGATCSQACGRAFLPFYSQCEQRIIVDPRSAPMTAFRATCQTAAGGGGH